MIFMRTILPALAVLTVAAPAAPAPSAPANLSREGDLVTVNLTPEAEQRLRLVTAPVARRAVPAVRLFGGARVVDATLDYWNDRGDAYRVYLRAGERLDVSTAGTPSPIRPALGLWLPGTTALETASVGARRLADSPAGSTLRYRAERAGWYVLDVRLTRPGFGPYRLTLAKTP